MQTWIFYLHYSCDYACQWLFFSASVKLSVKSACFPGEDACWHRNVLSFLWSFVRRVFFVLWQHFLGFAFFPCTIRKVRGRPVAEGSLPRYRRDSRGKTHCFCVRRIQRKRTSRRYRTVTEVRLKVFSSSPFTLREVLGSVFKLNSHLRVTTTIFISSRWPNVMKYRRLKTCS